MTDKPNLTGTRWLKEECLDDCPCFAASDCYQCEHAIRDGDALLCGPDGGGNCEDGNCPAARLELQLIQYRDALEAWQTYRVEAGKPCRTEAAQENLAELWADAIRLTDTLPTTPDPSGILEWLRAGTFLAERMRLRLADLRELQPRMGVALLAVACVLDEMDAALADYDKAVGRDA